MPCLTCYFNGKVKCCSPDALVELTLPKDTNIYAQQYALCLPDKSTLQKKLKEWIADYENDG